MVAREGRRTSMERSSWWQRTDWTDRDGDRDGDRDRDLEVEVRPRRNRYASTSRRKLRLKQLRLKEDGSGDLASRSSSSLLRRRLPSPVLGSSSGSAALVTQESPRQAQVHPFPPPIAARSAFLSTRASLCVREGAMQWSGWTWLFFAAALVDVSSQDLQPLDFPVPRNLSGFLVRKDGRFYVQSALLDRRFVRPLRQYFRKGDLGRT
jgi:hypothetical protein